jgi:hypothetical protein
MKIETTFRKRSSGILHEATTEKDKEIAKMQEEENET